MVLDQTDPCLRAEHGLDPSAWCEPIYGPPPAVVDGLEHLPRGPGWGLEPRPDWLAGAERKVTSAT